MTVAAALVVVPMVCAAQDNSPAGLWTTIDDNSGKPRALVRIVEENGVLEGAILKIYPAPGEEVNPRCTACSDARRDEPIVGMTFLSGLRQSPGEVVWTGGTILDPKTGQVYRSQATLSEDGKTLKVRGYIGVALFGRTQTWVRAEP